MSVSDEIRVRIQAFTTELEQLVRQAAISAVQESFGVSGASAPARSVPRASNGAPPATIGSVKAATRRSKKGGKRDPKLIEALVGRVGDYVKQHPGEGVEGIAKGLNVTTHDITLPVTKLLAAKTIKKKGQKRATKYFPS